MAFINTARIAARKGFTTYRKRNGTYVPGQQLNKKQLAKGVFLHGYYWLGNAGGDYRGAILNGPQLSFSRPISPGGIVFPHTFMVGAAEQGGKTVKQVDFELFARRIMSLLSNKGKYYSPEEIINRYNIDYATEIQSDSTKKMDQATFNVALLLLNNSKRVEVNREGQIRFYGQDVLIKGVSTALSARLRDAQTLHQLAEIVSSLTSELFRNVDLYLRDGISGEMLIIAGEKEGSTYERWAEVESKGLFEVMFKRLSATNFKYIPDIRTAAEKDGPIFPHNITRYEERYAEPNEAIYCADRVRGQAGHGVAVKLNEWASVGEEAPNRSLYSENQEISRDVVNGAIKGLVTAITSKVHDIVSSQGGMTLKEIWQKEERGGNLIDRLIGVQAEDGGPTFSTVQYHGGSSLYRSGSGFVTEYNDNPAKNYVKVWETVLRDSNKVAKDVLGVELPEQEMKEHRLYASHSFTDRIGTEVTGFADSNEYSDYRNAKGTIGRLIYYAGIMVKREHRGGRAAYLTYKMMFKIFNNLGWLKLLLYGKIPLVFRTQDSRIFSIGNRYFTAKHDPSTFNQEDWNAVQFVAGQNEWKLEDETNITRKVYHKKMVDKDKCLLPGLGETDGKVCVGYVSRRSVIRLLWDVWVKKKFNFNGEKVVRTTQ